tara:strand:- start:37689 stop:37835 length:147 start_codon:yes stop_codon:yes gene_type:complete
MKKKASIEFEVETEKGNDYLERMFESGLKRTFDNGTVITKFISRIYNK